MSIAGTSQKNLTIKAAKVRAAVLAVLSEIGPVTIAELLKAPPVAALKLDYKQLSSHLAQLRNNEQVINEETEGTLAKSWRLYKPGVPVMRRNKPVMRLVKLKPNGNAIGLTVDQAASTITITLHGIPVTVKVL